MQHSEELERLASKLFFTVTTKQKKANRNEKISAIIFKVFIENTSNYTFCMENKNTFYTKLL